jgi:hypothetical protein
MNNKPFLPAAVLALGLVLAALVFGLLVRGVRNPERTLRTVGSASQPFVADIVKWRLTLSRMVPEGEQSNGYATLRRDAEGLRAALRAAGVPDSAFSLQPGNAQPWFGPQGVRTGYNLQQPIFIISNQPEKLEALAINPGAFLSAGTALEMSQLEYFYSKIAELKHSLLGAATRDAKLRAQEIAKAAGGSVGDVVSARAGVFQITEPYSTEVSGYGMHSTSTRKKEITVTVHADFRLR